MKKNLLLLVICLLVLVVVSCQKDTHETTNKIVEWYELADDASLSTTEKIDIYMWHSFGGDNQKVLQTFISEFNALYPNVTVHEENKGVDYKALETAVANAIPSGSNPHLVTGYGDNFARYASSKRVLALNNFVNHPTLGLSEEEIADFVPGFWREGASFDKSGTILAFPFAKSTEALYYNKTFFEEHNLTVPQTWAEVEAVARQIKILVPDSVPFGYDSEANLFISSSEQKGIPYTGFSESGYGQILFNNQNAKDLVKYFKDLTNEGLFSTPSTLGVTFSSDRAKIDKLFMAVGSTGGAKYNIPSDNHYVTGVAPVPQFDLNNKRQIQQGPNICLFKKDNVQEMIASWLFLKYITEAEQSVRYSVQSGYSPVRLSAFETATWKDFEAKSASNPTNLLIMQSIQLAKNYSDYFFTSIAFSKSSKAREVVETLLAEVLKYDSKVDADIINYINAKFAEAYEEISY